MCCWEGLLFLSADMVFETSLFAIQEQGLKLFAAAGTADIMYVLPQSIWQGHCNIPERM